MMELPTGMALILGALSPIVVAFVKKEVSSPQVRWLIAVALSGCCGVIAASMSGEPFTVANVTTLITIAFAASQAAWGTWKGLTRKAT